MTFTHSSKNKWRSTGRMMEIGFLFYIVPWETKELVQLRTDSVVQFIEKVKFNFFSFFTN
jgi:hypothetical protein